jgi:diguanylate cyclase (GGDEF)-like protein
MLAITPVISLAAVIFMLAMVLLLWAMVRATRAARAGDREARTIAAGLVILLLCLVADILGNLDIIPDLPGIPIVGFTALFLLSASALNTRYEREHRELVTLRADLEQRVSDRTRELEVANLRLAEASRTDALTSLPNRRGFLEMSEQELKRCARNGEACSVVMIDLDHFKEINDLHGHAAGDALLQSAASLLRSMLRDADLVARWGGEEFILLLPDTKRDGAVAVSEKIRAAFERGEKVTASFGVAEHGSNMSREATIAAADEALYRAKREGRNRVVG